MWAWRILQVLIHCGLVMHYGVWDPSQHWWFGVGGFSKVVATFNHVGGSFYLFMATTEGVWIIPSFRIWDYVLYVEHISCVITNCRQYQWTIPSLFSIVFGALLEENITRKLLLLSLDLFIKILLFQVTFLISFSSAISSNVFRFVCYCSMWLCFSQEVVKYLESL